MKKILIMVLLSLSLLSIKNFAVPTVYGPTGLIEIPTAEALKYKEFNIAFDYNINEKSSDLENYFYKLSIGTFKGWELGVVGGTVPTEGVYVNAKYYLMSDNSRYPISIAIGMERLSSRENTKLYLVASKKFEGGLNGHLGFNADFMEDAVDSSIIFGTEYFLNNQFSILADLTGESSLYRINAGIRFFLNEFLAIKASVLDIGNAQEKGSFYNFGLSYSKFL